MCVSRSCFVSSKSRDWDWRCKFIWIYFPAIIFILFCNEIESPRSHVHHFDNGEMGKRCERTLCSFLSIQMNVSNEGQHWAFTLWSSLDWRRKLIWTKHNFIIWNNKDERNCRSFEKPFRRSKFVTATVVDVAQISNFIYLRFKNFQTTPDGFQFTQRIADRIQKLNKIEWKLFVFDFFSSGISTQHIFLLLIYCYGVQRACSARRVLCVVRLMCWHKCNFKKVLRVECMLISDMG